MNRKLILDGYNIINIWSIFKALKDEDLSLARDRLIRLMGEYQAYTGNEVIIVFDGAKIEGLKEEQDLFGVRVIFSRPPVSADTLIERLVYKESAPSSTIVVTSDSFLRNFVLNLGISCCSPQNLEKEVNSTLERMRRDHLVSDP